MANGQLGGVEGSAAVRAVVVFDVVVVDETSAFEADPVEPAGWITHDRDPTRRALP